MRTYLIRKALPERSRPSTIHMGDVHHGYDLRNLQTFARFDSAGGEGVTNTYDAFGRQTSSTLLMDVTARALGYGWDASGNRTRLVHPDGQAFATVYDGLNRPVWMGTEGVNGIASVVYLGHGAPLALNRLGSSLAFGQASMSAGGDTPKSLFLRDGPEATRPRAAPRQAP